MSKGFVAAVLISMFLSSFGANAAPLMYVPTGEANDIVVIDLGTDKVVNRIAELENAHGLAGSVKSQYLVAGSMQVANESSANDIPKPAAVSDAEHVGHHAEDAKGNIKMSTLAIVHIEHGHVTRRIPVRGLTHHTAVSPDGKYAIAVHPGAGGISVLDLARMEIVKEVQTGRSANYALFSGDGSRLYVSNTFSGTVSEIDTTDWGVKRTFDAGKDPEHLALNADNSKLYVVNVGDKQVAVVDIKTATVVMRYNVGTQPHGLDLSNNDRWMFVSSQGDGKLMRFDLKDGTQQTIDLQTAPYHVELVDAVNKIYVSSRKLPKIWVIDQQKMTVLGDIDIGKGVAHQMVVLDR